MNLSVGDFLCYHKNAIALVPHFVTWKRVWSAVQVSADSVRKKTAESRLALQVSCLLRSHV